MGKHLLISEDLHKTIKINSAKKGKSMKQYVEDTLSNPVVDD